MQPKAAKQFVVISLLLASSFLCVIDASARALEAKISGQETASKSAPLSYEGQLSLSVAQELAQQKKYAEALTHADKAVRTDPKSGKAHIVRAYLLDKLGQTKKADSAYDKAVNLSPNNGYVRYAYANHLCEQDDYAGAEENYIRATKDANYPFSYKAYQSAAECALKEGKLDVSEAHARAALAIEPTAAGALSTMAYIMHSESKYFEARAFIQRREDVGTLDIPLLQLAQKIEKAAGDDRAAAKYQKQLDLLAQAQIQPPTGEGQKKP